MFHFLKQLNKKLAFLDPSHIYSTLKPGVTGKGRQWLSHLMQMSDKLKDLPLTNYNLGVMHFEKGNLSDAILRFTLVNFLDPSIAESHYYLGKCFVIKGAHEKAKAQLEAALELKPGYVQAQYVLDKMSNVESINEIPKEIIEEKYTQVAKTYRSLAEEPEETYRKVVREFLKNVEDKNPNLEVLELGCETGLCGLFLKEKEVVKHIVGVDMSLYMLERARMKNIGGTNVYDVLLHENVVKYLGKCKDRFDAIFVSGVLYSFRDPSAALSLLNDRLKDQGYLIFIKHSVPISHKGEVYFDHQTDHFFHSKALLSEKLRSYNFALASSADIILSDEQKGELLVFKRG